MSFLVTDASSGGGPSARPPVFAWRLAALAVGLGLLAVLVTVVAPNLPRLLGIETRHQYLVDSGIEAGAFFYTGVSRVPQAEAQAGAAVRSAKTRGDKKSPAAGTR